MQCGPCLPARPQVSQGPFFRGSLRRGHTSPLVASCFGQTMTLAGTWCQLAAAVAKALTSCMQRGVILLPRKLQQPGTPHSHMVFGAPLNSAIPSHTDHMDFPGGSDGKESACNAGDLGSIPGWEDPLEEGMATHSSILAWRIPMGTLFARFHMGIQNTEVHQRRV